MRKSKISKKFQLSELSAVFKDTKKLVLLGVLSALGAILMLIEIPYPPAPFLKFDLSDLPILLVAQSLGLWPAVIASIIKSLVSLMVRGMNSPLGIGLITAAISSIALSCLYVGTSKFIKGTKWSQKVLRFIIVISIYSLFMTICNYLFITPIFLGGLWYTDVSHWVTLNDFMPNTSLALGYAETIAFIYIPFNALKGFIVLCLYEMISSRLLRELNRILNR